MRINQEVKAARARTAALVAIGPCLSLNLGCGKSQPQSVEAATIPSEPQKAEAKSNRSPSVERDVHGEIGRMDAEKRAKLLADAQAALAGVYS